jgi:hypothetical protein
MGRPRDEREDNRSHEDHKAPSEEGYFRQLARICHTGAMSKIDFTDEERRALADLAREYVWTQRYPLAPIKAALLKLAPNDEIPPPPGRKRPRQALR